MTIFGENTTLKKIFLFISFYAFLTGLALAQPIIEVTPIHVPILKGERTNPLFRIKIISERPQRLTQLVLDLSGSDDLKDIQSLDIFSSGPDSLFSLIDTTPMISKSIDNSQMVFQTDFQLKHATNYLWISCDLRETAPLLNLLRSQIETISLDNKEIGLSINPEKVMFRYGLALRKHNQDGIHTTRIPGLATTANGTLLAIYDARRNSSRDLQGDIDIGLNRSFDGGETWQPIQIVLDMDEWGNLPEKFNGVSDACILVNDKDIYVAGLWMHGVINPDGEWIEGLTEDSTAWNHQWRNKGSQPGFDPKQTSQFLLTKSTDDGLTWTNPINLTTSCKKESWWLWAPAPGRGIVMEDGTLVFPTQGRDDDGLPFSNMTFSQDNGTTWQTSNPASHNTTECSVVEYEPGKLMLNIRDNRNRQDKSETNGRAVFKTDNLGKSWTEHPTSHKALIEPVCMASLYKHQYSANGEKREVLLFSNPNSKYHRVRQTIKMSFDGGNTWPKDYWILLDEGKGRGYSCITSIDDNTIGIVYEGSRADLIFQKIDLQDFLVE